MKTYIKYVMTIALALAYNLSYSTTIVDYTFPKNSTHNSVPSSETSVSNTGTTTGEYSGTFELRSGGIRLKTNTDTVYITLPTVWGTADTIYLHWTGQSDGNQHGPIINCAGNTVSDMSEANNEERILVAPVGIDDNNINASGHNVLKIYRFGGKSVMLRRLVISRGDGGSTEPIEEPDPEQLIVNEAMIWDWTQASALQKVSPSASTDTLLMSSIEGITENYSDFDARYIMLCGENAVRNGDACQVTWLMLKLGKPGHIKVTFCNVGDGNKGTRYLYINGENTGISSDSTETHGSRIVEQDVPAGELVFTAQRTDKEGNQAIRIMRIEYAPQTETAVSDEKQILVQNGIVTANGNETIEVFTPAGQRVASAIREYNTNNLPSGIYIIRLNGSSIKIKK